MTADTPVFQAAAADHTHWTWECPCGYRTPFFYRTENHAQAAYDQHRETCPSAPSEEQ